MAGHRNGVLYDFANFLSLHVRVGLKRIPLYPIQRRHSDILDDKINLV